MQHFSKIQKDESQPPRTVKRSLQVEGKENKKDPNQEYKAWLKNWKKATMAEGSLSGFPHEGSSERQGQRHRQERIHIQMENHQKGLRGSDWSFQKRPWGEGVC